MSLGQLLLVNKKSSSEESRTGSLLFDIQ